MCIDTYVHVHTYLSIYVHRYIYKYTHTILDNVPVSLLKIASMAVSALLHHQANRPTYLRVHHVQVCVQYMYIYAYINSTSKANNRLTLFYKRLFCVKLKKKP